MTADAETAEREITLDDLKHKAVQIKDLAEAEVRRQAEEQWVRNVAIAGGVVLFAIGFAYFLGTRRAPACPEPPFPYSR